MVMIKQNLYIQELPPEDPHVLDLPQLPTPTYNTWRPSVLCRSGARLEQFAARDTKFGLVADVPTND